jgi:putative aldouronate transport system substrate-binding protein
MLIGFIGCTSEEHISTETAEYEHIVMTYPYADYLTVTGRTLVEEAVNEITRAELGIEVEFRYVDAAESRTLYPTWITQGDTIDLMLINYEAITDYADRQLVLPMEELLEQYGQGILDISENYLSLTSGTTLDDHIYGIAIPPETRGTCGGLWVGTEYLDEVSFAYDPDKIYSFEELDALFADLKALYPDCYPLGQITNMYSFTTFTMFNGLAFRGFGGADPAGLDIESTDTTIVDLYETERFYEWISYLRKWYEAGYIYPESATTTVTSIGLFQDGMVLSIPQIGSPFLLDGDLLGHEIECLRLSPIYYDRDSSTGIFWTIPTTSTNPESAMKFLNFMYTDERMVNLFENGVEGIHYEKNSDGTIRYLTPEDASETYTGPLGVFGDQRLTYEEEGKNKKAIYEAYSSKAQPLDEEYFDFEFDDSDVLVEIAQIETVKNRYLKLLEAGCVDLDTVYPEFIDALYDAGLQTVIDEKQRQFDAWLEENEKN